MADQLKLRPRDEQPEPTLRQARCARRGHCEHSYVDEYLSYRQCCMCDLKIGIVVAAMPPQQGRLI